MNVPLLLLALCQGLLLTNNVALVAINSLVGLVLAPTPALATFPIMGNVVGGALFTLLVARHQRRWGRTRGFHAGLSVAIGSTLLCAYAASSGDFWLLVMGTVLNYYYNGMMTLVMSATPHRSANLGSRMELPVSGRQHSLHPGLSPRREDPCPRSHGWLRLCRHDHHRPGLRSADRKSGLAPAGTDNAAPGHADDGSRGLARLVASTCTRSWRLTNRAKTSCTSLVISPGARAVMYLEGS